MRCLAYCTPNLVKASLRDLVILKRRERTWPLKHQITSNGSQTYFFKLPQSCHGYPHAQFPGVLV